MHSVDLVIVFNPHEESFLQRFITLMSKRQFTITRTVYDLKSGVINCTVKNNGSLPLENLILQITNMHNCIEVVGPK